MRKANTRALSLMYVRDEQGATTNAAEKLLRGLRDRLDPRARRIKRIR